jgi:hypothetical protein
LTTSPLDLRNPRRSCGFTVVLVPLKALSAGSNTSSSACKFREHSGNIQGTFREHSGNIQSTFREHSRNIQGTFREHSVHIQGTFSEKESSPGRTGI